MPALETSGSPAGNAIADGTSAPLLNGDGDGCDVIEVQPDADEPSVLDWENIGCCILKVSFDLPG